MSLLDKIKALGATVVVVTHDLELVRQFDHRIVTIENGRIVSDIPARAADTQNAVQQEQAEEEQDMQEETELSDEAEELNEEAEAEYIEIQVDEDDETIDIDIDEIKESMQEG